MRNTGDSGSGKSTVVARLKGEKLAADQAGLGTGVEYSFIDVRDEDSEGLLEHVDKSPVI